MIVCLFVCSFVSLFVSLTHIYSCSNKNLTNVDVAANLGITEKTVREWRSRVMECVVIWLLRNPIQIGGPGFIVEVSVRKVCLFGYFCC